MTMGSIVITILKCPVNPQTTLKTLKNHQCPQIPSKILLNLIGCWSREFVPVFLTIAPVIISLDMSSKTKSSSKERAKSKTDSRNSSHGKTPKQRQLQTSHDKSSDAKGSTTSSSIHEGGEILFVDSTTVDFSGQGAAVIPATLFTSMLFNFLFKILIIISLL